jgi:hypothetical protein
LESDGMIPMGTFIEFTWHSIRPEPEDVQENLSPGDCVQWLGVMGDEPTFTPAPNVLSDTVWKPQRATDD